MIKLFQIELLNFSLYCSNWTEKNTQYKMLLLYTMRVNCAGNLKLHISSRKNVSLELFLSVSMMIIT